MDYFQFNAKRLHLNMVAFGKDLLRPVHDKDGKLVKEGIADMTPARFDLLFAVHGATNHPWMGIPMWKGRRPQADLGRLLGLHKVTISKMLKRLEQLGLVWRERDADKRRNLVHLTEEGFRRMKAAFTLVFGKKRVRYHIQSQFKPPRKRGAGMKRVKQPMLGVRKKVFNLFMDMRTIAEHFGRGATLYYDRPFKWCD